MNGFSKGLLGRKPTTLADLVVGQRSPTVGVVDPDRAAMVAEQKLWNGGSDSPVPPPGHLFPVEAFDRAGGALWKEAWTGREMQIADMPLRPLQELPRSAFPNGVMAQQDANMNGIAYLMAKQVIESLPGYDIKLPTPTAALAIREEDYNRVRAENDRLQDQWIGCRVRWKGTVEKLCHRIATGSIRTIYRIKGGGLPQPVPSDWWQIDSYFARLRSCGINPEHPFDPTAERTAWFFVNEEDLDRELGAPTSADESGPSHAIVSQDVHLSPYIRLMLDVAHIVKIGPEPEQQAKKDLIVHVITNEAERRGLELVSKEAEMMATFIREPFAKQGIRKALADKRARLEGNKP